MLFQIFKFSSEYYFNSSKKQKTTGFILLGGGVALITGGALAMPNSTSKGGTEGLIILGGVIMATASIPFFVLSGSSKRKAKLYMGKESLLLAPNLKTGNMYNSIGIKIDL